MYSVGPSVHLFLSAASFFNLQPDKFSTWPMTPVFNILILSLNFYKKKISSYKFCIFGKQVWAGRKAIFVGK